METIFTYILTHLLLPWWFSLPGFVANICPGMARALPGGKVPISERYLGPNKTIMALPAAIAGASLVTFCQSWISYPDHYPEASWVTLALCFGLGTVLGDWAKSHRKRRRNMAPGEKWWIEKIDFLLMSLLFLTLAGVLHPINDWQYFVVPIGFMLLVHGPGNRHAYRRGWRNSPH